MGSPRVDLKYITSADLLFCKHSQSMEIRCLPHILAMQPLPSAHILWFDFLTFCATFWIVLILAQLRRDVPRGLSDGHSNYFSSSAFFGDGRMTNSTQPEAAKTQEPATGMRGEIQQKWGRFDADEIAALKDKDDLVAKLQTKYQLDKPQAQKDVDAFAKGRQL